jgi:hypothetical protein
VQQQGAQADLVASAEIGGARLRSTAGDGS